MSGSVPGPAAASSSALVVASKRRQQQLGSQPLPPPRWPPAFNPPSPPTPAQAPIPTPHHPICGVLGLEWAGAGALLPLRCEPNQDRVIVQTCRTSDYSMFTLRGCRRVLLVPPEAAVAAPGGLAPFPLLHPYDCYSQPAGAVCRLLEGWALAAEVAPGPELTRVLSGMADYHEERRALEREQRRQQQLRLISHSLHPTFNTFTPAGRVMTDLYEMAARHVAVGGVARTALAAVGRAVGQTVGQAGGKAVGAVSGSSGMHDAEKARVGFAAVHAASRVEACQEGQKYQTESGGKGVGDEGGDGGSDDTAAPEDDDDGLAALLRLVVGERLNRPTDWVNRLCRDADVVRDARAVVWYDDTRSEAERRFPELFRLQIAGKHAAARQTSLRPAALTHTAPLLILPSVAGVCPWHWPGSLTIHGVRFALCIDHCLAGRPPDHKDCPVCRTNLHSRRSLRPDPSFDRLLRALYGAGSSNGCGSPRVKRRPSAAQLPGPTGTRCAAELSYRHPSMAGATQVDSGAHCTGTLLLGGTYNVVMCIRLLLGRLGTGNRSGWQFVLLA
eukprot:XP_001698711.1 predicted protein [Chlamydomonas reinhardtii]